jgi:DNA-binding NtrC family response regulator
MFIEILQNPGMAAAQNQALINELKNSKEIMSPSIMQSPVMANNSQPVLMQQHHHDDDIHHHEEVEESLNIMDMEKDLIMKALKKHKGKRKDAATDLGISERTLYRKLKEYDIKE